MKKWNFIWTLLVSLLLTGCSWLDGSYVSVEPHHEQRQEGESEIISATSYLQLMQAMEEMIAAGAETGVIHVPDYDNGTVESGMAIASGYAMKNYPIGAYAVEDIHYELGTSSGLPAVAVTISYRRSLAEIQRIRTVEDVAGAEAVLGKSLENCASSLVLLIEQYEEKDFAQMVSDYAETFPGIVMEIPQVTEGIYGTGNARVVELIFTYQNSRDSLRQMKAQVEPVLDAAKLYVSGDGSQRQKFSQLYAFLMERFDYTLEKSITPAYSLLSHGVGDSRAFATVYAFMCREAGLECHIITGTRAGEPWTWNMVVDNERFYHVDLLRSNELGYYREFTDGEMNGYVWDYSAYPVSADRPAPAPSETARETEASQETTIPDETTEAVTEETVDASLETGETGPTEKFE